MPGTSLTSILKRARHRGGSFLLENESLDAVDTLGIATPRRLFIETEDDVRQLNLDLLPGDRAVVKLVAKGLTHKTELGGVEVVPKAHDTIGAALEAMSLRLTDQRPAGFLVEEFVEHDSQIGGELLLSLRWTDDFGPVVTLGPGGIQAETLSRHFDHGRAAAILSPVLAHGGDLERALEAKTFLSLATESQRGREPVTSLGQLAELVRTLFEFAESALPGDIAELEINPLVFRDGTPVALDALIRLGSEPPPVAPPRPLAKLEHLLKPRTMAIMGVSTKMNPGRIVLDNVLAAGFDPEAIRIVKPGHEMLAGCRCVPDLASLPKSIDLAVLCIGATELPAALEQVIRNQTAESLILIAGGLGERPGSEGRSRALLELLHASRREPRRGPLVNGGNCLGVRSLPGHYDTLFIPRHKLSYPHRPATPLALISQSGALAVAKASCLAELNPLYLVSLGNQIDLTVGDYLEHLEHDSAVRVFACYVEGFRALDGQRWLESAARITQSGRAVVLYRAGRTEAGGRAAATHTASIAGEYAVTRELAAAAGVIVADTLEDFEDLVRLTCALDLRRIDGNRLAALSNAGFECVAAADGVRGLELAAFAPATNRSLDELLAAHHLSAIVGVGNPLDVTPILGDEAFAEAFRLVLADEGVDLGLVGCVPLTGALQTLQPGDGHGEDVRHEESVVRRLGRLWSTTTKAWVAAVDGGPIYDAMAHRLAAEGIPVLRSIDRAVRLLERYAAWRSRSRR